MTRNLAAVADRCAGRLVGNDAPFGVVTTDTRALTPGSLFVAIAGPRFDGNDFVADAEAQGAAGALVSRLMQSPLPQVHVPDTRAAFGAMARAWRENFAVPVIAVTGSAGKTTVKELIANILRETGPVCVTQGSLNNDIGVPLTLMRASADDRALVIELGANHAGEIAYLANIVQPTVGVITNAAAAHLEGFGSLQGVAHAKGELLDYLPRAGTAVLNADDTFFAEWQARSRAEFVVKFGRGPNADCRLLGEPEYGPAGARFSLGLPSGEMVDVTWPLLGPKNVVNALAAAAAAHAAGATANAIAAGLARAEPVKGRLVTLAGKAGATIIDDSYNANPSSAKAAVDYLGALPGRRIFVLGDMGELGPDAADLHAEVGAYAQGHCDELYAIGPLAARAADAFGERGRRFEDLAAARTALEAELASDVTVLIKASRFMGLERLAQALAATAGGPGSC
jgi:UDP-N-acetylmuramoyl-tripeptide--D-alanyl-D-alanine ligase